MYLSVEGCRIVVGGGGVVVRSEVFYYDKSVDNEIALYNACTCNDYKTSLI